MPIVSCPSLNTVIHRYSNLKKTKLLVPFGFTAHPGSDQIHIQDALPEIQNSVYVQCLFARTENTENYQNSTQTRSMRSLFGI